MSHHDSHEPCDMVHLFDGVVSDNLSLGNQSRAAW